MADIIEITDFDAPQLDIYARAYEKVWQQPVLKKVIYFLSSDGVSPRV